MKLRSTLAACVLLAAVTPALANALEDALAHYAEASAIANMCPTLKFDELRMDFYAEELYLTPADFIAGGLHWQVMQDRTADAMNAIAGMDMPDICKLGEQLYGIDGTKVPDLLIEE